MEFGSVGSSRMSCTCNNCLFMSASNTSNMVIDIDKFQSHTYLLRDGRADEVYLLFSNNSQQEIESMSGKMRRNKHKKFSSSPSLARSLFEWKIDCDSVKRFFPWFSSWDEKKKNFRQYLRSLFIALRMRREIFLVWWFFFFSIGYAFSILVLYILPHALHSFTH